MNRNRKTSLWLAASALLLSGGAATTADASTLTQNTSWTINRSGTSTQYRVVAYGDSIFAGYYGSIWRVARRAAPMVAGEYLSDEFGADIRVVRRTKSGAKADDIYNNKIIRERSWMQSSDTRVVMFEMCGNDYLQARDDFANDGGTCQYSKLDNALAACTTYTELAMQAIDFYANPAATKMVSNLYYPGYDDDDRLSNCNDSQTGQRINMQDAFLPLLARSNWRTCNFANQYGFACADSFAEYMGGDYDSNGDGQVDSDALAYVQGESENAYVQRVTTTLRSTLRDANQKFTSSSTSRDYILSDNVHPSRFGSATIRSGLFRSTGSGSGSPDFSGSQIQNGKNPQWNNYGHERMGWALSVFNPNNP